VPTKLLILGVNGFIGHSLSARVLKDTDWEVYGMDLDQDRIAEHLGNKRFRFLEGDISINREWIEYHVKKCDVVLPLVAIATPKTYVTDPLRVFELDFEENLRVVRQASQYKKRVIFPSTSEVYGMCTDAEFNEETSNLVLGPITKQRWIYSCAKQLLDRVIWAYGKRDGLRFTLFRPFNWIGPNLDDINAPKEGSSRVVTQFLGHLLRREPVNLVDGGRARRAFTYVDDGIDGLIRIIRNEGGKADGKIFNLGNPGNDCSVRELAETMIDVLAEFEGYADLRKRNLLTAVEARDYYGPDYQDVGHRVPDISAAREHLGWQPRIGLREAIKRTVQHYLATDARRAPPDREPTEPRGTR
jgi:nucleoside-diphosphate-sugar epimerase